MVARFFRSRVPTPGSPIQVLSLPNVAALVGTAQLTWPSPLTEIRGETVVVIVLFCCYVLCTKSLAVANEQVHLLLIN